MRNSHTTTNSSARSTPRTASHAYAVLSAAKASSTRPFFHSHSLKVSLASALQHFMFQEGKNTSSPTTWAGCITPAFTHSSHLSSNFGPCTILGRRKERWSALLAVGYWRRGCMASCIASWCLSFVPPLSRPPSGQTLVTSKTGMARKGLAEHSRSLAVCERSVRYLLAVIEGLVRVH
jgi:hypothetical protein